MRRINMRPAVVIAVSFALGIFSFYRILFGKYLVAVLSVAGAAALLIYGLVRRSTLWRIGAICLAFLIAGGGYAAVYREMTMSREVTNTHVVLTGRVTDLRMNGDSGSIYYLEDCRDTVGNRYRGKVRVYSGKDLSTGDVVSVEGRIACVYPVKNDIDTYAVRNRIYYQMHSTAVLEVQAGRLKPDEAIRRYIYDSACRYMPNNAGTLYALLTGDRNALDSRIEWAFGRAGIAHLLAVSGLHVGFIATLLGWILRRLRLPPVAQGMILCIPLLFYAYICAFTPSVVRAVAMTMCAQLAYICFCRYDPLTAWGWSGLIVLLICPFYLFDMGFRLSFMSVFGIITLHPRLNRALGSRHIPALIRRLIDSLCISACCVAATLLVLAAEGSDVAVYGVLFNLIAIPMVSVAFVLGIFGMIPSVFRWLLVASDYVLLGMDKSAEWIASIPAATFSFEAEGWTILAVIALLTFAGGLIRPNHKAVYCSVCIALVVLGIACAYLPERNDAHAFVSHSTYGMALTAVCEDEAVAVGDFADIYAAKDAVDELEHRRVSVTLYIYRLSETEPDAIAEIVDHLNVVKVYILTTDANDEVTGLLSGRGIEYLRQFPNTCTGEHILVRSVHSGGVQGVTVAIGEMKLCMGYGDNAAPLLDICPGADAYLFPDISGEFDGRQEYTFTPYQYDMPHNYGANKYGNFTITPKGGTIKLRFD